MNNLKLIKADFSAMQRQQQQKQKHELIAARLAGYNAGVADAIKEMHKGQQLFCSCARQQSKGVFAAEKRASIKHSKSKSSKTVNGIDKARLPAAVKRILLAKKLQK